MSTNITCSLIRPQSSLATSAKAKNCELATSGPCIFTLSVVLLNGFVLPQSHDDVWPLNSTSLPLDTLLKLLIGWLSHQVCATVYLCACVCKIQAIQEKNMFSE